MGLRHGGVFTVVLPEGVRLEEALYSQDIGLWVVAIATLPVEYVEHHGVRQVTDGTAR